MCVIELESTDADAVLYDLIDKPVPMNLVGSVMIRSMCVSKNREP